MADNETDTSLIFNKKGYNKKTKRRDIDQGRFLVVTKDSTKLANEFWRNCDEKHLPDFEVAPE